MKFQHPVVHRWSVREGGHQVVAVVEDGRRERWIQSSAAADSWRERYTTLEEDQSTPPGRLRFEPAAYRDFAELDVQSDEAVEAFADRFGFLSMESIPGPGVQRERLADWKVDRDRMAAAIELLDAAREADTAKLAQWIALEDGGVRLKLRGAPAGLLVRKGEPLLEQIREDLPATARLLAMRLAKDPLEKLTHACLVYNPDSKQIELRMQPVNLLGAMWVQLALELEGQRERFRCEHCRKWLVREHGYKRADRAYCDEKCKARFHRKRKARARAMADEGQTVADIAREFGVKGPQVREWIKERERNRVRMKKLRSKTQKGA